MPRGRHQARLRRVLLPDDGRQIGEMQRGLVMRVLQRATMMVRANRRKERLAARGPRGTRSSRRST